MNVPNMTAMVTIQGFTGAGAVLDMDSQRQCRKRRPRQSVTADTKRGDYRGGAVNREFCFEWKCFSSMPPAGVIGEVNQAIAIVNLDLQHPQQLEPKNAGDFGARVLADLGQIEAHDIQVLL
jgi:hypothetical protein